MKMKKGRILFLCILSFYWNCSYGRSLQNFRILAGPLTNQLVKDLETTPLASQTWPTGNSGADDAFDCRDHVPPQTRDYFKYLQSRGVTHFKVPLSWSNILPTGEVSKPHEETVRCYKALVLQLNEAGIQPVLELHRSAPPEGLSVRYGSWENSNLGRLFHDYADFIFTTFGDLVNSYITFSHIHELSGSPQIQTALQVHVDVYELYHRMFKDGFVSLGILASDLHRFPHTGSVYMKHVDFLSLHIEYKCTMLTSLTETLSKIQALVGQQNIVMYEVNIRECADSSFQPLISVLEALKNTDVHVVGCDVTNLLGQLDQGEASLQMVNTKARGLEESTLRRSYQSVWEKFKDQSQSDRDLFLDGSFPDGFQWSVSTESFKVEGGWSEDGKGETIWDRFGHEGLVSDKQTGDVACDSYRKVDYDVYLLRGMLAPNYQFSISWARIFPTGWKESMLAKGAEYYDNLIDTLLQSGIQPTVTLHHWDLPQALQDHGGWTNESTVEAFKEFADFCFSRYGDRVKTWNTLSSPWAMSNFGYGTGQHAPSIKDPIMASYQVTHNMLKAHAEAWHVYNDKYRKLQGGKVGIALNSDWAEPNNIASPQDTEAAERYLNFMLGWFAHPIFVDGDYPALLKTQINQKNTQCGKELARLPVFTEAEKQRIKGTADFFGLTHHTSRLVSGSSGSCDPGPSSTGDFQSHIDPNWPTTASNYIQSVPYGLRRLLNYINAEYLAVTKVPIYITGNGMPTGYFNSDELSDIQRVDYLKSYINEAMKAIKLDSVNVQRFTVQSLMDGFEGPQGYSQRFGLHYVNFNYADKPRTPKASAYYISQIFQRNGFGEVQTAPLKQDFDKERKSSRLPSLPPSEVPSKSKVVWEKFSAQSKFQKNLYHYGTFPDDFQWGVSTSAYQVEGGWNADGKGPSVWDTFSQKPGSIHDNHNGNVSCDSYNKIEEDLYMLRALKVKSYRFSISWPRIFPNGFRDSLNMKGVNYYNKLIDGLIAFNIKPMVTLHHWDLPQALQDINGWENPTMIDIFNDYCDFCYETFGDRVKFWITFNQPHTIAWEGYGTGKFPPNVKEPGDAPYRIAHNLLKAHAKAYHTYDEKYRSTQRGVVSISLNADWIEPLDVTPREVAAADRALQFQLGWFAHPIFKNGDYPEVMKFQVGVKSEFQGLPTSRLPSFTEQEKAYIQGTADVFCINAYTSRMARHVTSKLSPSSYEDDQDVAKQDVDDCYYTEIGELRAAAWGLRRLLNWIKEEYGNPDIYITENGVSIGTTVDDTDRIFFLKTYIDEALKAQNLDEVRLRGYTATSLMDSFEWLYGYSVGFGLHHVDFNQPERPRTPKRSTHYYYHVMRNNGFPMPEEEKPLYDYFPEGFAWSVASSSYQIEGGWREDGKGLSIWDTFAHTHEKIENDDTGDVACDSYNKISEDVANLKRLGVNHYRFSISWPRIMPDGTTTKINDAGVDYYTRLVDALLAANIKPQATLYHWDLPQALQDVGGWENDTIVERFKDYADVMYSKLGQKVKFWITINEPYVVANIGYGYGVFAPGINSGTALYVVGHNLIKAHAEAWHLYNDKYRATQGGIVGITLSSDWAEPRNPYKQEDFDAARRVIEFMLGWFAHPVFNGDYSELMKNRIRERSLAAGLPKSRLPEFTPEEVKRIKGTHDYFGFNHYTTVLAFNVDFNNDQHYDADRGVATIHDRSWPDSGSDWLRVYPPGFRQILKFIKEEYGNPPIHITENGVSDRGDINLNDIHRIHYYENYINQALKAYLLDDVDIRSYTAWSLMDNLEWASGFAERFGIFYVNRSDPSLPRIPKQSAKRYSVIINCNGFPDPDQGPHECENIVPEVTGTSLPPTSHSDMTRTSLPPTTHSDMTGTSLAPSAHSNMTGTRLPPTTPLSPNEGLLANFLGLEVSAEDAEVALYVLFGLTIAGTVLSAVMIYQFVKTKKKSKRSVVEEISLEKKL